MNRSPAFQFYPDKWQSHTRRLSDSSYRVFHELICWMWQNSPDYCSVDSSPEAIACVTAISIEKVRAALSEIQNEFSPLLKVINGRLVSGGLEKEAIKQRKFRKSRSLNGKLGGRPKKASEKLVLNSAKATKSSPSPSPSPSPSLRGEPSLNGHLADGWKLRKDERELTERIKQEAGSCNPDVELVTALKGQRKAVRDAMKRIPA